MGALAGDDSADLLILVALAVGHDVMERQRTGGAKPQPGRNSS
ncbi:hypothetical protein ACLK1T_17780 [Escherichia coli]